MPVDAADGFENKDQRDFYFGGVDANRVQISAGRDIRFVPQHKGAPLNYFLNTPSKTMPTPAPSRRPPARDRARYLSNPFD